MVRLAFTSRQNKIRNIKKNNFNHVILFKEDTDLIFVLNSMIFQMDKHLHGDEIIVYVQVVT